MSRRAVAWVIDIRPDYVAGLGIMVVLVMFGLLTFGLGFGAMGILPFGAILLPFLSPSWAGQSPLQDSAMFGLTVRAELSTSARPPVCKRWSRP